jgi:hypothetical protein
VMLRSCIMVVLGLLLSIYRSIVRYNHRGSVTMVKAQASSKEHATTA